MSFLKNFYIVDGQPCYLNKVDSERLVFPSKDYYLSHVASRLADSNRIGIDTNVPNQFLLIRGDINKLEEIPNYSDVHCTRSIFIDADGFELILTNDVLVEFSESMSEDEQNEIFRKLNCVLVEQNHDVCRIRVLDLHPDAPLEVVNKLS